MALALRFENEQKQQKKWIWIAVCAHNAIGMTDKEEIERKKNQKIKLYSGVWGGGHWFAIYKLRTGDDTIVYVSAEHTSRKCNCFFFFFFCCSFVHGHWTDHWPTQFVWKIQISLNRVATNRAEQQRRRERERRSEWNGNKLQNEIFFVFFFFFEKEIL